MGLWAKFKSSVDAWFERQQAELDKKQAAEKFRKQFALEVAADEAKGADGRLQEQYDLFVSGKKTLDEYRDEILREQTDLKDNVECLRQDRPTMERDEYQDQKERLDEDREAIRWRLQWVNDQLLQGKVQK